MQKIRKIALLSLLSILVASVAYSALKSQDHVPNNVTVTGYGLELWNTNGSPAKITSINWGNIEQGLGNNTETIFSSAKYIKVKNVGDYPAFFCWFINASTPLPAGCSITCEYDNGGWIELPQNQFYGKFAAVIPVGDYGVPLRWNFTVGTSTPRGAASFNMILQAATTISG